MENQNELSEKIKSIKERMILLEKRIEFSQKEKDMELLNDCLKEFNIISSKMIEIAAQKIY